MSLVAHRFGPVEFRISNMYLFWFFQLSYQGHKTIFDISNFFYRQVDKCVPDVELCDPNPCHPGVQCEIQMGKPVCGSCPPDHTGNGLSCSKIDHCQSKPCYPGVDCSSNSSGFECGSCPAGYNGNGVECWKLLVEGKVLRI